MAKKAKDEIEVVFGFKHAFGVILVSGLIIGAVYVWGSEAGYKRALKGESSLLSFLEREADTHTEPVPIPEVLLNQRAEQRSLSSKAGDGSEAVSEKELKPRKKPSAAVAGRAQPEPTAPAKPPAREAADAGSGPAAQEASKPPDPEPKKVEVKVAPPVKPTSEETSTAARAAPRPRASTPRLHYQVAALKGQRNAKGLVDWLRGQGFPAGIQPAADDGLYRVYVGPFSSDVDASSAKARLAKDGFAVLTRRF